MGIVSSLKQLEVRYPWSLLAFVLGVIGIIGMVVGLYATFHERKPSLRYEILSESNVFNVQKPLPNLRVLFQGRDLQQDRLNLLVVTLRVMNDGETDILQSHFDQNTPWGVRIKNGRIIEARLLGASSEYTRSQQHLRIVDPDAIEFSKIIFDRGMSFIVEVLVLHPRDVTPDAVPFGKVAGIAETRLVRAYLESTRHSFWQELASGSPLVHLVRLVVYIVAMALLIGALVALDSWRNGIRERKNVQARKKVVASVIGRRGELKSDLQAKALEWYAEHGLSGIHALRVLAKSGGLATPQPMRGKTSPIAIGTVAARLDVDRAFFMMDNLRALLKAGLVHVEGGEVKTDPPLQEFLQEIIPHLESEEQEQGLVRKPSSQNRR
jgi:hypothetical protein